MLKRLIPDPFILGLLGALLFATLLPARGTGGEIVDVMATGAIVLLFFFQGAKLSPQSVAQAVGHWRLHLAVLASTFAMFPLLGLALAWAMPTLLPSPLWTGMLYLAALPSTVQSSIALTSMARGNVAAAIASASASQLLGVLLTPPLVGLLIGVQGAPMSLSGTGNILLLILAPFILGQLLRRWIGDWVTRRKAMISITDRAAILLAVYSAFSAAVVEDIWHRVPLEVLAILLALCLAMLAFALLFTASLARLMGLNREDRIVLVFCGTKKSLVQGVPMARILFAGPDMGLVLLPIMMFHQLQLMVCAWIARRYAAEADGEPEASPAAQRP
jgi:sodium/bile acid cotransporter 7